MVAVQGNIAVTPVRSLVVCLTTCLLAATWAGCSDRVVKPLSPRSTSVSAPAVAARTTADHQPPLDALTALEAAGAAATPPAEDAPPLELQQFAFTTLQLQRMQQLQDRDVQRELQLRTDQAELFNTEGAEVSRLIREAQQTRPEDFAARFQHDFLPVVSRIEQLVKSELSPEQEQLLLQRVVRAQRGAIALVLPGVPEHLGLTTEQRGAIFAMIDENRRTTNFDNLNNPLELLKLARKASTTRAAAEKLLTEDQRQQWKALQGK
jgi:hypothetical protein